MAITYTKPLKSIVITTIGGATVSASDTVTEPIATNALAEFERFETMHIKTGDGEVTLVPFHAVDNIVVTVDTSDEITRNDPYCEEEGD